LPINLGFTCHTNFSSWDRDFTEETDIQLSNNEHKLKKKNTTKQAWYTLPSPRKGVKSWVSINQVIIVPSVMLRNYRIKEENYLFQHSMIYTTCSKAKFVGKLHNCLNMSL